METNLETQGSIISGQTLNENKYYFPHMLINEVLPHQYCFVFTWHIAISNTSKTIQPKQGGRGIGIFVSCLPSPDEGCFSGSQSHPRKSRSGSVTLTVAHMASPDGGRSVLVLTCSRVLLYLVVSPVYPRQADIERCHTLEIIHSAPGMGGQPGWSQPLTAVRSSLLGSCH